MQKRNAPSGASDRFAFFVACFSYSHSSSANWVPSVTLPRSTGGGKPIADRLNPTDVIADHPSTAPDCGSCDLSPVFSGSCLRGSAARSMQCVQPVVLAQRSWLLRWSRGIWTGTSQPDRRSACGRRCRGAVAPHSCKTPQPGGRTAPDAPQRASGRSRAESQWVRLSEGDHDEGDEEVCVEAGSG